MFKCASDDTPLLQQLKPLLFHPSSGVSKEQRMRYDYYQAPICAVCMLLLTAKFRGLRRRQLGQIHNVSRGRARTNMALFLLITSGGAQNKAFLSGFYELYIRGSYRRGTNRQSSTSAITEAQARADMDQSNKRGRRSLLWRAVSFHSAKKKKKKDTDFRYYKSAQLIFVLIPLCLIENRVQKRGCLFITAAATAVCTPTSPIQPPAFIVAGNCAAGGKSRPAKLTILTSNERAGILITNFLQMAIGLRWFPSIFPMAAGRPVRHARQRPPPPSPLLYGNIGMATGERCLQVELQFCFATPSNGGGDSSAGFSTLICHFDNQDWLFQSEHKTD